MTAFRARDVLVEAVVWDGKVGTLTQFQPFENTIKSPWVTGDGRLVIYTPEGDFAADVGDWIVKNSQGHLSVFEPPTFDALYEEVVE